MSPEPNRFRVILLDRDGTINVDRHYLGDPDGIELLPGAAQGLRRLTAMGCRLVVVTNQSGVGRGLFTLEQMHRTNDRLKALLAAEGAPLTAIYSCPHAPDAGCDCRKPRPALALQAAAELGFGFDSAVMVGDKPSDMELGRRLGALTILVGDYVAGSAVPAVADFSVRDLGGVADVVERLNRTRS